jgi:hypothetical protein
VADEVDTGDAERVQDAANVGDEALSCVVLNVVRAGAGGVATLVDGDDAVPGVGQGGYDVAPGPRGLGEAVEQQHGAAVLRTGHGGVEGEISDRICRVSVAVVAGGVVEGFIVLLESCAGVHRRNRRWTPAVVGQAVIGVGLKPLKVM